MIIEFQCSGGFAKVYMLKHTNRFLIEIKVFLYLITFPFSNVCLIEALNNQKVGIFFPKILQNETSLILVDYFSCYLKQKIKIMWENIFSRKSERKTKIFQCHYWAYSVWVRQFSCANTFGYGCYCPWVSKDQYRSEPTSARV